MFTLTTLQLISFAVIAVNLGMAIYNYRLLRRWSRLNDLLLEIVTQAWLCHRASPVWRLYGGPSRQPLDKSPHSK